MNADSLFDLTPPEKLQLVEDLWDDLAAVPSDVPVHDWQKEELARRKANLMEQAFFRSLLAGREGQDPESIWPLN